MTEVLVVLAAIGAVWAAWVAYILLSDRHARRTDADNLEMRAWREKVDAFRRLSDQDGDA